MYMFIYDTFNNAVFQSQLQNLLRWTVLTFGFNFRQLI